MHKSFGKTYTNDPYKLKKKKREKSRTSDSLTSLASSKEKGSGGRDPRIMKDAYISTASKYRTSNYTGLPERLWNSSSLEHAGETNSSTFPFGAFGKFSGANGELLGSGEDKSQISWIVSMDLTRINFPTSFDYYSLETWTIEWWLKKKVTPWTYGLMIIAVIFGIHVKFQKCTFTNYPPFRLHASDQVLQGMQGTLPTTRHALQEAGATVPESGLSAKNDFMISQHQQHQQLVQISRNLIYWPTFPLIRPRRSDFRAYKVCPRELNRNVNCNVYKRMAVKPSHHTDRPIKEWKWKRVVSPNSINWKIKFVN